MPATVSGQRLASVLALVLLAVVIPASLVPAVVPAATAPTVTTTETAATTATAGNAPEAVGNDAPEIVALYPNPATDDDAGEFVVVRFPTATNLSRWSLTDGESNVSLSAAANRSGTTISGRVVLSPDPAIARNRTDAPVFPLPGGFSLSNDGETVRLVGGDAVTEATYRDAPEAERWRRTDDATNASPDRPEWTWTPVGATDFAVARTGPASVRAFVLPDSPAVPIQTLRGADRRLFLAGYTFVSERAADALAAAARRGVRVRVLVDGAPVGGLPRREAKLLDSLVARGVEVRVVGGPLARYDFHHAKYAVADDRALVLTENWKPAGTGGRASRGWGVLVRNEAAADRLADVFAADAGWRGATPWSEFRRGRSFEPVPPANGSYPSRVAPTNLSVSQTNIIVAPDNAEHSLVDLLDSANESIRVQQVAIGGRRQAFLRATLRAARRGVEVKVLLSSAWYVEEDNRELVEWLNGVAEREDLPLEARLANPRGRYEKIHAKGVVVDREATVVGSLNWNDHAARENREVAVVLRGEEVGEFYAGVFDEDWQASGGGVGRVPVGLLGAVAVGALVAILVAKREVSFETGW